MEERNFEENRYMIPFSEVPRYVLFSHKDYGICDKCPNGQYNAHSFSQSKFVTIPDDARVHTLNRTDEFRWDNGAF